MTSNDIRDKKKKKANDVPETHCSSEQTPIDRGRILNKNKNNGWRKKRKREAISIRIGFDAVVIPSIPSSDGSVADLGFHRDDMT